MTAPKLEQENPETNFHWPPGTILLAATPIGNLLDASPRLIEALRQADLIAAEDTRRTGLLRQRLGVEKHGRLLSFHDHNEGEKLPELLQAAHTGQRILVVSDAGMPTVSDPGFDLVKAASAAGLKLSVLPGPSAVLTALALSGCPTNRFSFEGFLPRKGSSRRELLAELKTEKRTMIFFESPHRLGHTLHDLAATFGAERRACVCRELTKLHEDVWRGSLAELASRAETPVKGEIVIVVAGQDQKPASAPSWDTQVRQVFELVEQGERMKQAVKTVSEQTGSSRRELYNKCVETR